MKSLLTQLEQEIMTWLQAHAVGPLHEATAGSCSEVSRLVGLWILRRLPEANVHILQGKQVMGTEQIWHDVLAIDYEHIVYLMDPTVWQFFPEQTSTILQEQARMEDALEHLSTVYGGMWTVREQIQLEDYEEEQLKEVIIRNLQS